MKDNQLISKKHKKVWKVLNYVKHLLILASDITACASFSTFVSLVGFPIGIASSAVELNICVKTAGVKMYKLIIKKKRKKSMMKQIYNQKLSWIP